MATAKEPIYDKIIECLKKYEKKGNGCNLLSRILVKYKELGYDETFLQLAWHHVTILNRVNERNQGITDLLNYTFISRDENLSYYVARLFIQKLEHYSRSELQPVSSTNVDSIERVPIEAFLTSDSALKEKYETGLLKDDIVYAEMTNTNVHLLGTDFFQLRLIGKLEKDFKLVYHHDIILYMIKKFESPRLDHEQNLVSKVLKVRLFGQNWIQPTGETVHGATLNPQGLENPELGIISPEELPFNMRLFKTASEKFTSYSHYLRSHPNFSQSHTLKDDIKSLGLDPYHVYTFDKNRDEPDNEDIKVLRKRAEHSLYVESHKHITEAKKYAESSDIENALVEFDKALKIWPKNYEVYELRGKMYIDVFGIKRSPNLLKACCEFETAIKLNPNAVIAKEIFSKVLTFLAKGYIKQKKLSNAKIVIGNAIKLSKDNKDAVALMSRIDESLQKEYKMELQREVKKLQQQSEIKALEDELSKLQKLLKKEK